MEKIYIGNAKDDGQEQKGWIVGSFMPADVRQSDTVEIKYGVHKKGDARSEWVTGEERTTIFILVEGTFSMEFKERSVILKRPGDYVMWGAGVDHKWEAVEDATGITVRWVEDK